MKITEITPSNEQGLRDIYVDGEFYISLPGDEVMAQGLRSGQTTDVQTLERLTLSAQCARCRQKAYSLLSYGARSRKTLADKLCRAGFDEAVVEMCCDQLTEYGLLDDRALAERYLEVMRTVKYWGNRKIRFEMARRGIEEQLIEEMLAQPVDERQLIQHKLHTKFRGKDLSDPAQRQKVMQSLARQGFSFDDIRAAMAEWEESIE